jgi:enoyl-[acyl-carrier protein] reductase I
MELENKKALVFGVANKRSLAWGITQSLKKQGADVIIVCQTERLAKKMEKLALELGVKILICDASETSELQATFEKVGMLDIIVHSIAYAPSESVSMPLSEVDKEGFLKTMEISVYSLIEMVGLSKSYLNDKASFLTLSYLGAQRVMTGYNLMGVAKAALESSVRYLSVELGKEGHRINAISAGPVKTLSSSVFPNFNSVLDLVEERTPLKENISSVDVGELASFLSSERSRLMTGTVYYVDSGAHIMGA